MGSRFMSSATLWNDPAGQALYRTAIVEIIGFAVEKLNDKAVYANTLVFSGRVLGQQYSFDGAERKLTRFEQLWRSSESKESLSNCSELYRRSNDNASSVSSPKRTSTTSQSPSNASPELR